MTVWQQLLFPSSSTPGLAAYWLSNLHLDGLEARYPSELSGGQCQRVALAQVLCNSPHVLLLDEPFSALDVPVRQELRRTLRKLQRETGVSTVLVTHDPEEAAFLSEELVIIADGRALQCGPSREVFSRPATPEVARLLGIPNLFTATVASERAMDVNGTLVGAETNGLARGTPVAWSIRPEKVAVLALATNQDESTLRQTGRVAGTLIDMADVGTAVDLFVAIDAGVEIQARTSDPIALEVGDACEIVMPVDAVSLWPIDATSLTDSRSTSA